MDKIWDRKSFEKSEVIGRCGGDETHTNDTQNRQKSNAKKNQKSKKSEPLYIFGAMFKRI